MTMHELFEFGGALERQPPGEITLDDLVARDEVPVHRRGRGGDGGGGGEWMRSWPVRPWARRCGRRSCGRRGLWFRRGSGGGAGVSPGGESLRGSRSGSRSRRAGVAAAAGAAARFCRGSWGRAAPDGRSGHSPAVPSVRCSPRALARRRKFVRGRLGRRRGEGSSADDRYALIARRVLGRCRCRMRRPRRAAASRVSRPAAAEVRSAVPRRRPGLRGRVRARPGARPARRRRPAGPASTVLPGSSTSIAASIEGDARLRRVLRGRSARRPGCGRQRGRCGGRRRLRALCGCIQGLLDRQVGEWFKRRAGRGFHRWTYLSNRGPRPRRDGSHINALLTRFVTQVTLAIPFARERSCVTAPASSPCPAAARVRELRPVSGLPAAGSAPAGQRGARR